MPTRKVADVPRRCRHPEHDPPRFRDPGVYEHECPACGAKRRLVVRDEPYPAYKPCPRTTERWPS